MQANGGLSISLQINHFVFSRLRFYEVILFSFTMQSDAVYFNQLSIK